MYKKQTISKWFISIIVAMWFAMEILFNSKLERILLWGYREANDFMAAFVFILLLIEIVFFQEYTKREIFIVLGIAIPVVICTYNSNNNMMISTIMFIVASKHLDFDRMVRISCLILIIMTAFVFYLYFFGVINEVTIYRGSLIRHSWGFDHPNWLGVRIFQVAIMQFYIYREKIRWWNYAIILFAAWFVYKVPNCQTACYALLIFLFLLAVYRITSQFENGTNLYGKFLIALSIAVNVLSVYLSVIDVRQNAILRTADDLMSRRFSWCHRTLSHYGVTLFGQNVELYGRKLGTRVHLFYVDTAYVAMLVRYGVIVYIVFSVLYIVAMCYAYKSKRNILLIILTMYAIYGIMENTLCSLTQNVFLFALAFPVYSTLLGKEKDSVQSKLRYRLS